MEAQRGGSSGTIRRSPQRGHAHLERQWQRALVPDRPVRVPPRNLRSGEIDPGDIAPRRRLTRKATKPYGSEPPPPPGGGAFPHVARARVLCGNAVRLYNDGQLPPPPEPADEVKDLEAWNKVHWGE